MEQNLHTQLFIFASLYWLLYDITDQFQKYYQYRHNRSWNKTNIVQISSKSMYKVENYSFLCHLVDVYCIY